MHFHHIIRELHVQGIAIIQYLEYPITGINQDEQIQLSV